jgi:hypothetical protein
MGPVGPVAPGAGFDASVKSNTAVLLEPPGELITLSV